MKSKEELEKEFEDEVVDFLDEDYEDMEENSEGEISEKEMAQKVKQGFKTFFGLNDREKYGNTMDFVINGVSNNGIVGAMKGLLIAGWAVLTHMANVAIQNIIFGEAVHLNFRKAIEDADRRQTLIDETEKKKRESKQKGRQQDEKEVNGTTKDEIEENKSEQVEKEQPRIIEQEFNASKNENIQSYMDEMKEYVDNLAEDEERLNSLLKNVLDCGIMQNVQKELGIEFHIDDNSDRAYILRKDQENDLSKLPYVSKMDLIKGDAQTLGPLFYDKDRTDGKDPSLAAATDAIIFSSKLKNEVFSGILDEMRTDINPSEDKVLMSYLVTETPEHTAGLMYTLVSQTNESVDIFYKGKMLGTVDLMEPYQMNADKIYEQIAKVDETKIECTIGEDIAFHKKDSETVVVKVNGVEQEFQLKEQADMKPIADFIEKEGNVSSDRAMIDALLISAKMNPFMDKTLDENGFQINPFTNNPVDKGDLILTVDNDFYPSISEYNIGITNSVGMAGCNIEQIKNVVYVHPSGNENDLKNKEDILMNRLEIIKKQEIPEQLASISSIVFDRVDKHVVKPMEAEQVGDGTEIYQQLKENSIFDGKDMNDYHIVQEEEYNEPPISEDMIREAEEAMREAGEQAEL